MNKIKQLLLISIFSIFISSTAIAQIIDNINITGAKVVDRGTILNYLLFETGDFYSKQSKIQLQNNLINTGLFKDVIITDNGNNLNIEVMENPVIKTINIEMDSDNLIKLDQVNANLLLADIEKGSLYNKIELEKIISKLRSIYSENGYDDAVVEYEVIIDTENLAIINISIAENDIVKIDTVKIVGNSNFTENDLLDLMSIGESDFILINYFTKKDSFSKIALDADVEKITNFYLNNGYLDIKVSSVDVIKNGEKVNIVITLNEGNVYTVGNINFSKTSVTRDTLLGLLDVKSGDIFERAKVVQSIQNINNFFADQGYAFAKIKSKTSKREKQNIIDFDINIDTKQKVYINRITIDGNTRTQDDVVRREIGILEGGLYSDKDLQSSINKIKRLGYFADISMKVSKVKGADDRINLHFTVKETHTGQFSIGMSHSNSTGVSFNTGIKEKNIFGTGNELNARLEYSKAVKNINFYFLDPYFTVDGHSLSYGIFTKSVDGSELESSSYIIDSVGGTVGYGVPLDEDSRINLGLKLSKIDINCGNTFAGSGYEQKQCADDYNNELYTSISYNINTLNNYNFPTQGHRLTTSFGIALPLMDYRYYKFDTSYRSYRSLNKDFTLKLSGKAGIADGYSDRELPFFERYYGGGSSSVRGFSFNSLGAKYPDNTSKGGKLSLAGSASVISRVPFIKDSSDMRLAGFMDVGGIDSKVSTKGVDPRASVGVAFVWITPIGPLGIYTAQPIKKKDGDDTKTFDFTLGTTF